MTFTCGNCWEDGANEDTVLNRGNGLELNTFPPAENFALLLPSISTKKETTKSASEKPASEESSKEVKETKPKTTKPKTTKPKTTKPKVYKIFRAGKVPIIRHNKIKSKANPFVREDDEYYRLRHKELKRKSDKTKQKCIFQKEFNDFDKTLLNLWKREAGNPSKKVA